MEWSASDEKDDWDEGIMDIQPKDDVQLQGQGGTQPLLIPNASDVSYIKTMEEHGVASYNGIGKWKNPRLRFQGFEYTLSKNVGNVTYYKCHQSKCSGRLNKRGEICTTTRGHNLCKPMLNLQSEAEGMGRNMNQKQNNRDNDTDQDIDDADPSPLDEFEDTSGSPRHKLNRVPVALVRPEQVLKLSTQESQQTSADTSLEESQTTHDEVLPRENRTGFKKRTFTPPLVWGFDRGLKAKEIVGSSNYRGPIKFLVRWEGSNQMDLVLAQEMNERFPEVVLAFYEKRLGWNKPNLQSQGPLQELLKK